MRKPLTKSEVKERINSRHYYIEETRANKRILQDRLNQTRVIIQYKNGRVLGGVFETEFF